MAFKSDIEIARAATKRPIQAIGDMLRLHIPDQPAWRELGRARG